jgi:multidrug transporter EmrE-like cation transporter
MFQPRLATGVGLVVFALGVLAAAIVNLLAVKGPAPQAGAGINPLTLAVTSGFIWGFAQLFFILMLAKNAPVSVAVPVVIGGIGIGGVLAGVLLFGETLTLMRIIGIAIVLAGSILLGRS